MDDLFAAIRAERLKLKPDAERLQNLETQFRSVQASAQSTLIHDEFQQAFKQAGGADQNAGTGFDYTIYYVSLPSNKAELWMNLESDRFLNPVLRELFKEMDVVMEERRLRVESDPVARLWSVAYGGFVSSCCGWAVSCFSISAEPTIRAGT